MTEIQSILTDAIKNAKLKLVGAALDNHLAVPKYVAMEDELGMKFVMTQMALIYQVVLQIVQVHSLVGTVMEETLTQQTHV